jgi:hypothetical protein
MVLSINFCPGLSFCVESVVRVKNLALLTSALILRYLKQEINIFCLFLECRYVFKEMSMKKLTFFEVLK